MIFADPLYLLLILGILAAFLWRRKKQTLTTLRFSAVSRLRALQDKKTVIISRVILFLRYLTLLLIVITLARPQGVNVERSIEAQGIDIMLTLDVSGSMAAEDFQPNNRLAVAKERSKDFILDRKSDRIGLVVFGSEAFTQCPLTLDYDILLNFIDNAQIGMSGDGTAIGVALATSLNRLKDSKAKSKIIILLTDGESNGGEIDPQTAAELAKSLGIKIYTIGIGKDELVPMPYMHPLYGKQYQKVKVGLDEESLKSIAQKTEGQYFHAVDAESLKDIYTDINSLEKTKIETKVFNSYDDMFPYLLWLILGLISIELIGGALVFVRVP